MRILHTITTLDVGGAEMHLLAQVTGQCARGHNVRVVYLKGEGRLRDDFLAAGALEVERLPLGLAFPFALRRHLGWCDVVHTHLLKADMSVALVATLTGHRSKLIASKHNDEQVLKRAFVSRVHGLLGNLPRRTIVLSDHVGRFIAEHGRVAEDKLQRIYYGLDPSPFEAAAADGAGRRALREELGFGRDDVVFVCVARFAPQKAHDVLLTAFSQALSVAPSGSRLRLALVGDDPFGDGRVRAEAHARSLGLIDAGDVVFCGIRRDVPRLLAASDVFVMASLWEGLGLVFLEAMACGLPVLSTRVSAIPEVVVNATTGVLVPPSDSNALAEALVSLAREPKRRQDMGVLGRQRVKQVFDPERMIDETLAVYRAVLSERGPRA